MRTRLALLGVLTAGVMLTQQACANTAEPAPAGAPAPVSAATSATPAASEPAGEDTEGEVPVCKTADIEATITLQPGNDGEDTRRGLVTLTNKSGAECGVNGRAAISLKNPADEVVDVPTENVDEPGKSVPTALKSGSSAFQGIKWTVCDKGDATCGAGNTLVFNLEASTDGEPAELEGFPAAEKNDITMKSLRIGTIQPSRQGVVAW